MKCCLTIYLLLLFFHAKADNVFYWKWRLMGDKIQITGSFNGEVDTSIFAEVITTKSRFATLYHIIDEIEYSTLKLYNSNANILSTQLVEPFSKSLAKCQLIVIDLDTGLLNFGIEFLHFRKQSIALYRPMVFTINSTGKGSDTVSLIKGSIIRDPTSDPENACRNIYRQYPASEFKSAYKIREKDLGLKNGIDFILISAHGDADSLTFRGGIALNKIDNMPASFLTVNDPKLVYIDGCQQGINWTYIGALAQTSGTNFYLGPIVSNDSGESSTKTINWFFDFLRSTGNPCIALWKTRKKLYDHYQGKIRMMDTINKSFIFRIYKV